MRKMQALQPKMQHIQNKYKGKKDQASKEAMSREMMKLYQDNDANPMGSCWTAVIQGPVFMCMFYMLSAIPYIATGKRGALGAFDQATAKQFAQTRVFGVSVTDTFGTANNSGKVVIGFFILLMCACMWYMQFNNMRKNLPKASMQGSTYKMQQAMTWGFPIMYIFSGIMFPFAVLVYWLTNNACNLARSLFQVYKFPTRVPVQLRKRRFEIIVRRMLVAPRPDSFRLRKRNWRRRARKPLLVWSGDTSASSPSGRIARKVTRLETSFDREVSFFYTMEVILA